MCIKKNFGYVFLWLFMCFCFYYWKKCGGWSWGLDGVSVGIWVCNS